MSYEIVRNISRRKDGRIFITSASNNVWPRHYSRWEYMPDKSYSEKEIKNKELYLFRGIIGGSYQLSGSVNENWKYAGNKFYEYCRENNISTSELWELPYKNEGNIELLQPYYEVFKKFLEEKKEGKYYLNSSVGVISKVNEKGFSYVPFTTTPEKYCKSYKKIFNDYCNISKENRENYEVKIKEYVLENEFDKSNDNNVENVFNDI